MNKFIPLFLVGVFSSSLFAKTPYIPFARTLHKGGVDLEVNAEYFQTQKTANTDGEVTDLSDDASHVKSDFNFIAKYGVTDQFELNFGTRARYIKTTGKADFGSGEEDYSLSTSGLESYHLGGNFSFKEVEGVQYSIEGYYRQAAYSNEEWRLATDATEVAFGNGSREYALGINAHLITKSNNIVETKVLYRSPSEELSHEIFGDLRFALVWNYMSIYAGVEGVMSRNNDPYTNDEENKPLVFQGESKAFNGINRSYSAPYLGMNFALGNKWRLNLKGALVSNGVSTDLGPKFLVSIGRRSQANTNQFTKKNQKFKQYRIEGVVSKVSKSRKIAIIDKGVKNNLRKGMSVDFYFFDFVGGNELIASGKVTKLKYDQALVRITKRYSKRRVKEGTVARADQIFE